MSHNIDCLVIPTYTLLILILVIVGSAHMLIGMHNIMRMCLDGLVTYPGTKDLKRKGRNTPGVFVILLYV